MRKLIFLMLVIATSFALQAQTTIDSLSTPQLQEIGQELVDEVTRLGTLLEHEGSKQLSYVQQFNELAKVQGDSITVSLRLWNELSMVAYYASQKATKEVQVERIRKELQARQRKE